MPKLSNLYKLRPQSLKFQNATGKTQLQKAESSAGGAVLALGPPGSEASERRDVGGFRFGS